MVGGEEEEEVVVVVVEVEEEEEEEEEEEVVVVVVEEEEEEEEGFTEGGEWLEGVPVECGGTGRALGSGVSGREEALDLVNEELAAGSGMVRE